jgi:hypothetical protein
MTAAAKKISKKRPRIMNDKFVDRVLRAALAARLRGLSEREILAAIDEA